MGNIDGEVYKTHDQNLSYMFKGHYIVTYNAKLCVSLLCVSSADVDFWVNGGWDQPECGITLNLKALWSFLQNPNIQGEIKNFVTFRLL
jgi:hypothetical protein